MSELVLEKETISDLRSTSQAPRGSVRFQTELKASIPREGLHLWIDQKTEVLVFSHKGKLKAFNSICPHMGAQLQYNRRGSQLSCPWHDLDFDIESKCSNHHKFKKCQEFSAEVTDGVLTIYRSGAQS